MFLLFGRGACFFFAVWAGGVFFFCCLGGGVFVFCCLGGGVFFFLLFGPGACSFFAVWAGDGRSLTYPSAWLVFKRPNNKRDRTAKKKKHGFLTQAHTRQQEIRASGKDARFIQCKLM